MINKSEFINSDERLNVILEKISLYGIKSIKKDELIFLKSYSIGKEEEINKKMSEEEINTTFISDDGFFSFKLINVEYIEDIKYINGIIKVPDLTLKNKKKIKGELKGSIIVFLDNNVAIDFKKGRYDIFEFINGLEYELDCFVDDIILKVEEDKEKKGK